MLKDQVIQAVKDGLFHIWPIETIDQGLGILTGTEPGQLQEDGSYPTGTFNQVVLQQLKEFSKALMPTSKEGQNTPETGKEDDKADENQHS